MVVVDVSKKIDRLDEHSKKMFYEFVACNSNKTPRYIQGISYALGAFMSHCEKDSFKQITVADAINFYNNYECTKNTRVQYMVHVNLFLNFCVDEGYLPKNPILKYKQGLKASKKERVYLTEKQQELVLSRLTDFEFRFMYIFLVNSGLRREEFRKLKFIDVDLDERIIHVREGKGDKYRFVPISDELYIYLKRWNYERSLRYPVSDAYLVNKKGKGYARDVFYLFSDYIDRAVPNLHIRVTPHILRHTFATNCLNKGMDLKTLSTVLGHEDIKTTSIYVHKNKEQIKKDFLSVMNKKI